MKEMRHDFEPYDICLRSRKVRLPLSTVRLSLSRCHVEDVWMDGPPARKEVDIFLKRMENPYVVSFFWERYPHMGYRQIDGTSISGSLPSG